MNVCPLLHTFPKSHTSRPAFHWRGDMFGWSRSIFPTSWISTQVFWRIVVKILEKLVQICASNLCEIGGGVLGQCLFYGQVNNAQTAEIVCKPQNSQHNFSPSMLFYYPFRIAHSVLVQKNPQKIHFKRRYFPTIELSSLKLTFCATGIRPPWKTDPLGIWPMFVRRKFLRLVSRRLSRLAVFLGDPTLGNKKTWRIGYRI